MPVVNYEDNTYHLTGYPQSDDEIAFDVYETYLKSFVALIANQFTTLNSFVSNLSSNPKIKRMQVNKKLDIDYIRRFLFIGWNTEYLAKVNDGVSNIELLRVNNQWKPIQVYYSIYSLGEAACYAIRGEKADGHKQCLQTLSDYLISFGTSPWNLAYKGCLGRTLVERTIQSVNFPKGSGVANALQRVNLSPVDSAACCLQAEHIKRISEYKKGKIGPYKYQHDPGNTTLLHFLYKLRIKSNYKDAEIFLSEAPDRQIKSFSLNLTNMNRTTNILLEVIILKKVGKSVFIGLINDFLKKNEEAKFLIPRKNAYSTLITF